VSGQLKECRAGGRELQSLGDVSEKLRVPNDVCVNRLVLEELSKNVKVQEEM